MLQTLHIENMAVIERADMELTSGFNVLTGETGAGKSIVVDAIGAVLGARISREMVRSGAENASVTAVFTDDGAKDWLSEYGVESEDGSLFITRRITADGKGTCRVNGTPVPVSALRELGSLLLDIHGQTDGHRMAEERYHLGYLDGFGRLRDDAAKYLEKYKAYSAVKKELEELNMDENERERRMDALRYRIDELENAGLKPGETEQLTARRELLRNISRITDAVEAAYEALYGGDSSDGVMSLISQAEGALGGAARYADGLSEMSARLSALGCEADDIALTLRDFRDSLDNSPHELDEIEMRLDKLRRLSRKYGGDEEEMLECLEKSRTELESIELSDERRAELEADERRLYEKAKESAEKLSGKRRKAAEQLRKRITEELAGLSMPGVGFEVEFIETELSRTGVDEVRFLMSANAGEKPGRISRIASGGELSRIMLAMKSVLASGDDVGAMVFDEIDTGVSGRAASRVGEKLAVLSLGKQVICVTHLPQIAAMADTHFDIAKSTESGRTYTRITRLDRDGRRREIARLTGGDNITETALSAAEELLKTSEDFKAGRMTNG